VKLTLTPVFDGSTAVPSLVPGLSAWYSRTARIRRLWAIERLDASEAPGALRVVVTLEPVGDSDETDAAWMASGRAWQQELRSQLAREVDLEWADQNESDDIEIDGDGVVIAVLCWRDPTSAQA
jgi:hypothetical protein